MEKDYSFIVASELNIPPHKVKSTITLLDEGSTVPFISRYRKEATGSLDEVFILNIRDRVTQLRELDKRRTVILSSIKQQKKLTPQLEEKIKVAETLAVLEDIYLPYKPKRRTKGMIAKEKGLEPLAKIIFDQNGVDIFDEAKKFVDEKKEILNCEGALEGARHIISEWMNEDTNVRAQLRNLYYETGIMTSKVIKINEDQAQKFRDYFAWQESVITVPSHRILAIRRGEKEKFLISRIIVEEEDAYSLLRQRFIIGKGADAQQVELSLKDSFKRLLSTSLETEMRVILKKRADQEAIEIFSSNLRELLLSAPLGQKKILAIDPGIRTGSKIVCLDSQGQLLTFETIYIFGSSGQKEQATITLKTLVKKYNSEVIAIGNGTGSRETESFVKGIDFSYNLLIALVSESGASIYSASEVAREEFPDHDVTVRGSISIGRRLMDPLAELVKIEPKSIGVGQYQHDVDQRLLKNSLDDIVMSCVNLVGVEINTASKQLLTYVSGLGPARAQAILDHRHQHGAFKSREDIIKIEGLGKKAIEQCIGFLRIQNAENLLDASSVHMESYPLVEKMAEDLNCSLSDLINSSQLQNQINLNLYVNDTVGMPTLVDIKEELSKPGRDPRESFQGIQYKEGIHSMDDLAINMKLPAVITNITAFGAFADIGVHQDGLIHISQMSDKFVKNPHDILKLQQKVQVTVLEIDEDRKRIALSLIKK